MGISCFWFLSDFFKMENRYPISPQYNIPDQDHCDYLHGMQDDRDPDSSIGFNSIEGHQTQPAELVKSSHHARRRDGSADHQEKDKGDQEEKGDPDIISHEEYPIGENNPQPDNKRPGEIGEQAFGRAEKAQALNEFGDDIQNFAGDLLRKGL
jgi:hypothetical protein